MIVTYIIMFFIYSFLGWIIESGNNIILHKKFVNRGFLIGPYCPIYGFGAVLMTVCLEDFINYPIILIILGMIICGVLEYFTSYIMETIFKARWWDYSNFKFNINGRICLEVLILFGLGGYFVITYGNVAIDMLLGLFSTQIKNIIAGILVIIILIDAGISFKIIANIKNISVNISLKDNTEEITKKVKEVLMGKSSLYRRLVNAFPNLKAGIVKTKNEIKKRLN